MAWSGVQFRNLQPFAIAATILGGFFCSDHIPFSPVTDSSTNAQPRMYSSFSEAASEVGRSRVFGGLHFEFSNQAGLTAVPRCVCVS
jgi:hypothetical protein